MTHISNTSQLSTFSIIKNVFKQSTILNKKFKDTDYYQFDISLKSAEFSGFPFIVISIPTTDTEFVNMDHSTTLKDFSAEILLVMNYEAKDKAETYLNAMISVIEANESAFKFWGYNSPKIDLQSIDTEIRQEKPVVVGTFVLSTDGSVMR